MRRQFVDRLTEREVEGRAAASARCTVSPKLNRSLWADPQGVGVVVTDFFSSNPSAEKIFKHGR